MSRQQTSDITELQALLTALAEAGIKTWRIRGNFNDQKYLHLIQDSREIMLHWTKDQVIHYPEYTGQHPKPVAKTTTNVSTVETALALLKEKR